MELKNYVYDRKKFCIPVTKAEPLESIQFIVDEFKKKKITFCVAGEGESWELWRHVEDGDDDKIKKGGSPPTPNFLYVDGENTEEYETLK